MLNNGYHTDLNLLMVVKIRFVLVENHNPAVGTEQEVAHREKHKFHV